MDGRVPCPETSFDGPVDGAFGEVADPPEPVPIGKAAIRRRGSDFTIVSLGVGAHRSVTAAERLSANHDVDATVADLRTVTPLDDTAIAQAAGSGRVLVVDEDYSAFGLSGEIAARLLERRPGIRFVRVATPGTIPYARHLEDAALPSVDRISRSHCGSLRSTPKREATLAI